MWNKKICILCIFAQLEETPRSTTKKILYFEGLWHVQLMLCLLLFFRWEKREIGSFTALLLLQLLSLATCIQSNSLCSDTFSMSCGEKMLLKVVNGKHGWIIMAMSPVHKFPTSHLPTHAKSMHYICPS